MANVENMDAGSDRPNVILADRFANPGQMNFAPSANYTFAGVCGILSVVLFVVLLVIQWIEYSALKGV